jgi:hypothetical protein
VRRAALVALLLAGCGAHRQVDRVWRTGDVTIVAQHRLGRPVPEFGRMQYSLVWGGRVLVPASPWPFAEQSVRLADVTGDGRPDALVTVECGDCNHATAIVDVWTDEGGHVQRIYGGSSNIAEGKGGHPWLRAVGKPITETAWGATRGGLLWFDSPGPERSVCCPIDRVQTFLRWNGRGWSTVRVRHVANGHDALLSQNPFPAP